MENLIFWNSWSKENKHLYWGVLSVFGLSILFFGIYFLLGAGSVIEWESLVQPEYIDLLIDKVQAYPFTLKVNAESIIFYEWFGGSDLRINLFATYAYLFFFAFAMILMLSVATGLSRFWYFVSVALFTVLLINFKLELLLLFQSGQRIALILALVAYLPLSYYFHAINKDRSLGFRIMAFSLATILLCVIIGFASGVDKPFLYIAAYGIPGPLVLTLIFCLMVALISLPVS